MLGLPPYDGSIISAVRHLFLFLGLAYPVIIGIMIAPPIQRQFVYQHNLAPFPLFAKFDMPEKYSLAPGKTANLYLSTPDNVTLGAWFVLSDPYHQQLRRASTGLVGPPSVDIIQEAISRRPTILFLHGAAATRAVEWRVKTYLGFTSRLQVNVLAPDYRGFGDSTGSPDNDGLVLDAYTSWNWLIDNGAKPEDILIVGHSLGTGVSGQLAKQLAAEGVRPRGVVLLAPFTSVSKLLETYAIFGVPILQPLQTFPLGIKLMKRFLRHEFDTLSTIQEFNSPTLIAHSQDDFDIPHSHSRTLIDKLLEPFLPEQGVELPSAPGSSLSSEDFAAFTKAQEERRVARSALVRKTEIPNFGVVEEFEGKNASKVVYVESFWGSHAKVGTQEGIQDEIGKLFDLL
ncbi:alpha/beta-hydrolase [Irpex rosettiformis]|uniref:Alpha/beta-hydrolase n=1 Tax=Irpex rosettiformis TaxID=378272 RepID=A0ACB8U2M0_9APHY|nr:alpha/beta-hydrolase [Irpex rosettiformis]